MLSFVVGGLAGSAYSFSFILASKLKLALVKRLGVISKGRASQLAFNTGLAFLCGVAIAALQQANTGRITISGGDKAETQIIVLGRPVTFIYVPWWVARNACPPSRNREVRWAFTL